MSAKMLSVKSVRFTQVYTPGRQWALSVCEQTKKGHNDPDDGCVEQARVVALLHCLLPHRQRPTPHPHVRVLYIHVCEGTFILCTHTSTPSITHSTAQRPVAMIPSGCPALCLAVCLSANQVASHSETRREREGERYKRTRMVKKEVFTHQAHTHAQVSERVRSESYER